MNWYYFIPTTNLFWLIVIEKELEILSRAGPAFFAFHFLTHFSTSAARFLQLVLYELWPDIVVQLLNSLMICIYRI